MKLVSDDVLADTGNQTSVFSQSYPSVDGFELWNPSAWTNGHPFAYYKTLRETAPVHWTQAKRGMSAFWSVTRYEDIKKVELAPATFSNERGSSIIMVPDRKKWWPKKLVPASFNSLINLDAPHHMEMRIQQKDFFIPAYVSSLREKVGQKIDELLDDMEANGPVLDFVEHFSQKLPLFTLCEMLGVEEKDRASVLHWMHHLELASQFMANPFSTFMKRPGFPFSFFPAVNDMFKYGEDIMAERRANPKDDLLSAIAHAEIGGEPLQQEYLDGSWLLIIFAGNDTTRNSLSGTIRLLTEFPDQRAMILEDPSLIPLMSEEALRMTSPVVHMRRTATENTELNGQEIAENEKVVLWYGAANRDPDIFPEPDQFNLHRTNVDKHLAFGHGVHKCLGSRIAKMQLRLSFEKILERFPNISWTGRQTISPNALVHAISSLEVNLYGGN